MADELAQPGHVTAKAYFKMAECGILSPDDRVELLEGLIVAMTPHSPGHAATIDRVSRALRRAIGESALVRVQLTYQVSESSVPEPDVAVVPGGPEDYFDAHPTKAYLVIEVAHSSLTQDRLTKAPIYARACVPTYWIVNLRDRCVEVFREPKDGEYRTVERREGTQTCLIDAFPLVRIAAADLLPPEGIPVSSI